VDERHAGAANLWSGSRAASAAARSTITTMPRVLIAEDDRVIANAMAAHLRRAGMDVEIAEDGERAIAKLRFERPDVAVLDLMLPGMDGWRITETLRAEGVETPIVIVSARGSEHDKVHALGIGGDDYLAKPFGMRELVARVEAVLRRAGMGPAAAGAETIAAGDLRIDPNLHAALLEGEDVRLTPTEFRLLYVLAGERGRALTRDQLQQRVWGIPHRHRDRTVDVCVRKLRDKIDRRAGAYTYIQTHYGVGYRFDAVPKGMRAAQPSGGMETIA
jgi:DNA-binding response OmpR family regulator